MPCHTRPVLKISSSKILQRVTRKMACKDLHGKTKNSAAPVETRVGKRFTHRVLLHCELFTSRYLRQLSLHPTGAGYKKLPSN